MSIDHVNEPANQCLASFQASISQPVKLWDQTLRDGEQTPGVAFTRGEKLELAKALDELGVHYINVGYPAVSEAEAETVRQVVKLGLRAELGVTSRMLAKDVDAAARTGVKWVLMFASLSDWHLKYKLRTDEESYLAQVAPVVKHAHELGLSVGFAIEDGTRTPWARLVRFIEAAENAGAAAIRLCDTVGVLLPTGTAKMFAALRKVVRGQLIVHFHNDLGMATANTLTALEAGADAADVALAGLGERAGNTSLEEVVVALRVKYGRDLGLKLERVPEISAMAQRFSGLPRGPSTPIVGSNVFSHESGIHVAGLLANPTCYEAYPPAMVGRDHKIVYGKHSGLSGVQYLLERKGLSLSEGQQQVLLTQIKEAGQRKELVPEDKILTWAAQLAKQSA